MTCISIGKWIDKKKPNSFDEISKVQIITSIQSGLYEG